MEQQNEASFLESSSFENKSELNTERENITYYYSKFDLFDESMYSYFLKYQIFKKKLNLSLGEDWHKYASITIFKENGKSRIYVESQALLAKALDVWLEMRKEINYGKEEKESEAMVENEIRRKDSIHEKFEGKELYEAFEIKFQEKFPGYNLDTSCMKAVLQGFYASSNKVWKETVENPDFFVQQFMPEDVDLEEKKEKEESYLKATLKTFTEGRPKKIIKPLLVASEKILDIFSTKKKGKPEDEKKSASIDMEGFQNEAGSFRQFHSNFEKEASEELKNKLKNLSLSEEKDNSLMNMNRKRKNGEIDDESNPRIQIKKFPKRPVRYLNPYQINYASEYIEKFMANSKERWQVARGFVTNIIEVNYNLLCNIENRISNKANEFKNHINIRFLQPATNFYHHLMKVWLIFKTNNYYHDISFSDYLQKVKMSMGNSWSERYFLPTQLFFETLFNEWNQIKQESENEETLKLFIRRVRENLLNIWEENIIKKVEGLNKKMMVGK